MKSHLHFRTNTYHLCDRPLDPQEKTCSVF